MNRRLWSMGIPLVASLALLGPAQAGPVAHHAQLEKLPYSGGLLMARAIRSGRVRLPAANAHGEFNPHSLNCAHAPCALPNVEGSAGATQPVDETPIAVSPLNKKHMITGGNDYNCTSGSYRGFWVSDNGGKTWKGGCGLDVAGQTGDGDPVVGYDLNGNVYQGGIESGGIGIASSSNNGKTWNPMVIATSVAGFTSDKPWLQIDTGAHSVGKNRLYVSSTQFDASSDSIIYVAHSADGGQTWTQVAASPETTYPNIDQFSDLATDSAGNVYLTYMNCTANGPTGDCGGTVATMYMEVSSDGGNTWSAPSIVNTVNLAPDSCGAFYGCLPNTYERVSDIPVIGIDRSGGAFEGAIYVGEYNWTGKFMQVQVWYCHVGMHGWGTPINVAPKRFKHDQFFPWLNVDSKGNVGVTWLDRRDDPSNVNYETFATWSANGGVTYKKNREISDTASNPFNDGFGGSFMGDYSGNAWAGKKLYAAWTDTRNGSYSQNEVGGLKR